MGVRGLVAVGVPPQPSWLFFVRIAILVLSLVLLAIGAWSVSLFGGATIGWGSYLSGAIGGAAGGLTIFTAIWSFIFYGGATAVEMFAPHLFYRVVFLIGYFLSVIFWLSAWAYSANAASWWMVTGYTTNVGASLAALAGLGAVVWVLTIIVLAFFIKASLHEINDQQAELGTVKHTEAPVQQQYPVQPAAPYGQQQPYAAQ